MLSVDPETVVFLGGIMPRIAGTWRFRAAFAAQDTAYFFDARERRFSISTPNENAMAK